jgi:putative ABC transport system permease protein
VSSSMIKEVTGSSAIPGMEVEVAFMNRVKRNLGDPYDPTPYKVLFIDYDYIPFYNLKLKAGRNYSTESGEDENWTTVIVNETAARALGFKNTEDAKDQEIYFHLFGSEFKKFKIVGVLEDYHHETAGKPVQPTVLSLNHRSFQQVFFSVKLNKGTNPQEALSHIQATWDRLFPGKPFDYFFQDEYYDRQFKSEKRFRSVFGLFTAVTMLIASLGIVGMTLFETNARLKEVTVRKVLGASVTSLVTLLSSGYFRIIIVSVLCSMPVVLYFSYDWLNGYSVRIEMSVWFYVIPVVAILLLVALSSGWQTIKAAMSNPVDHLRHD